MIAPLSSREQSGALAVDDRVTTYADKDTLTHSDGFRYAAFAVAAYVISRGLAKLGVREPYTENDGR